MRVAAIQFRPDKGNWDGSARALCLLIEEAVARGAQLVVCPEMALTGYLFADAAAARQVAEPVRGPTFDRFSALCRQLGCYLVLGYPEEHGGRLYNSALLLGPDGVLLGNYRKRLLYEADLSWATPGNRPYPLLQTPLGTLAAGICMDLNDDRFIAFLHRNQPRLVAFPTNWIHQGFDIRPYWLQRLGGLPCCFIAANTYGQEAAGGRVVRFLGRSAILGPDGRTLALAPEQGDAVLVASVSAHAGDG
ncbi:MAG: carbon-nitrogen hydrolase family protein [Myxococcales bacterium]|nr:carbon-nitrogen hydrolase family protein [Myxococcota bacterium]MDW8280920.1 carbon-nitrogen hydrolase family protein [Myxococcales bacterium]